MDRAGSWVSRIVVAVALGAAAAGCAAAGAPAIDTAERMTADGRADRVRLPDRVAASPTAPVTYRLQATLAPPLRDLAVYLPGLVAHARIAVNGHVVDDRLADAAQPLPRSVRRLRVIPLPSEFVQPGRNDIEIVAAGPGTISVSAVWLGDEEALRQMHERRLLGVVIGPAFVATVMACLALCVLLLWVRHGRDPLYGYFGVGALGWALHTGWTLLPVPLLTGAHYTIWWHVLYSAFVAMLVVFCLRFAHRRWPRFDRTLWLAVLAAPPLLYTASAFGVLFEAAAYWRLALIAAVAVAVWAVVAQAWRRRNADSVLLASTGAVSLAFAARDWLVARAFADNNPVYLTPYSGALFIVLVAWILIDRYVRTARELEQVNAHLEQRVAAKSAALRVALDDMRAARDRALAADDAKSRFLAAASHDLRQPIQALDLYLGTLRGEALAASPQQLVQRMGAALGALGTMLDALLDISRMDAGLVRPQPRPLDLFALLHRLADEFAAPAAAKGLRLAVHAGVARSTPYAHTDAALLERVVRNLLDNALKYTERGGVLLSWRLRRGDGAPHWLVEVRDTGSGIARADQVRVFDEFYQVANVQRDRQRGLGLGLSIVRRLCTILGAPLELRSVATRGTCVSLRVPATDEAPAAASAGVDDDLPHGLVVAVVEDDAQVRDALGALLTQWGCVVLDGEHAGGVLAQWRALGRPPVAAIVADYRLADGDTGDLAIAALRTGFGDATPAVLLTGDTAPPRLAALHASGFEWWSKPVAVPTLRGWLGAAVRHGVDPGGGEPPAGTAVPPAAAAGVLP